MKKVYFLVLAIIMLLSVSLFLISCDGNPKDNGDDGDQSVSAAGKVLILQAYASSSGAAGATHSFVELYNKAEEAIKLDGIFLYFANGHTDGVGTDSQWDRVELKGTIPAKGSFLITGPKQNDTGRLKLSDNYEDINDPYLELSNRSFKVALIKGNVDLNTKNILNPFDTDGNGTKVNGYIDMVGAINDPAKDAILGFETAPARCSASEAVRRKNLTDTDNNQGVSNEFPDGTGDFDSIRYALDAGISDELLELRKPRNSTITANGWDPFATLSSENPTIVGSTSEYAGKLLILQAGAATDGAITRSFVELYNTTGSPINLNTFSLQYGGTGSDWKVINLTGTIPAKGSYLIRGPLGTTSADSRLYIENADQTEDAFVLSNNGFKVALMENQYKLTVDNPFAMTGGTAAKYVDMLGAYNNNAASVDAFEAAVFTPISKQAAARRKSLTDTDNNLSDFERIDYRTSGINDIKFAQVKPRYSEYGEWNPITGEKKGEPPVSVTITGSGILEKKLSLMEIAGPNMLSVQFEPFDADTSGLTYSWSENKSQSIITTGAANEATFAITPEAGGTATVTLTVTGGLLGADNLTDLIEVTVVPVETVPPGGSDKLMILQIGAATDGDIGRSFIELYNNSNAPINLTGYSIQYAAGFRSGSSTAGSDPSATIDADGSWNVIALTGTIQPYHSYLILAQTPGTSATPLLAFTDGYGDKYENFSDPHLSNRSVKVVLMSTQTKLDVQNPFTANGGSPVTGYIDMIGAINSSGTDYIQGFEGNKVVDLNKSAGQRRVSLTDTNDNDADFDRATFNAANIEKFRPKNHAHGAWNPMTGNTIVLP